MLWKTNNFKVILSKYSKKERVCGIKLKFNNLFLLDTVWV